MFQLHKAYYREKVLPTEQVWVWFGARAKGNYYYYRDLRKEAKAAFVNAFKENQLVRKNIHWEYVDLNERSKLQAEKYNIKALVSVCEADLARIKGDWKKALERYRESRRFFKQRIGHLKKLERASKKEEADISSTERDIQLCLSMIAIEKKDFETALKHIDMAQQATEKAFDLNPSWGYYRDIYKKVIRLKSSLEAI